MAKTKTNLIDGNKLKTILKEKGYDMSTASREIGYESCYISNCIGRGRISDVGIILLDKVLNITYEDYKYVEHKEEIQEELIEPVVDAVESSVENKPFDVETQFNKVKNDLYQLVYSAVYEAVKKAWAE